MASSAQDRRPPGTGASASDPRTFVWVAANAGSGKTHVLVERLMRIMLEGTPPSRILCLTFTNAAAAEMANRLFERLSEWTVTGKEELRRRVEKLTGTAADDETLARARRLFPLALESPGGLKIHTIHAFCERLLHRFALEAGVSPHFSVIDERDQHELIDEAREAVMVRAAGLVPDAPLAAALATVSALAHDMSLDDLLKRLVGARETIQALELDDPDKHDAVTAWLAATLGVRPADTQDEIIAAEFADGAIDPEMCRRTAAVLAGGKKSDRECAERLSQLGEARTPEERYGAHRGVTLRTDGSKVRASLITKELGKAHPDVAVWLDGERDRAERLFSRLAGVATYAATTALLAVADAVIGAYQGAKAARGLLDYDDLIARARALLRRSEDAAWVLYKLDGGIDHILVDEAQDTSPGQWQIVQSLAEDMLAGETARSVPARATFAVGDEKQSIFSFQGADPAMFAFMRDFFARRAQDAGHGWARVALETSYRSAPAILAAVDLVFADAELARGLSADGAPPRHEANRNVPGKVEIWPTVAPDDTAKPDPWTAPVDYAGPGDARLRLASMIAGEIAGWLASGRELEAEGRAIRPGDILILVRRRNLFVDAVVRELKLRDVPVAGIDRMRLAEQIVVQDLMALARFVLLPEDDLSLAALVKSPLVGLGEDDLFALAYGRAGSLWHALQGLAASGGGFEEARGRLARWLAMADFMTPYAFFSRVLSQDGIRRAIMARLGPDAEDPVAEFLNAALDFERAHLPTLEGFLAWLTRSEGQIKRDLDHGRDEVRVMTVHGAKGLEANIVILPDTCQTPSDGGGVRLYDLEIRSDDAGALKLPVWPRHAAADVIGAVADARAEADRRRHAEYLRLLYVAMTRARDWLIVTGYETSKKRPEGCWYNLVCNGLEGALDKFQPAGGGERWLFRHAPAPGEGADGKDAGTALPSAPPPLPGWALAPPAGARRVAGRVTPSRTGADGPAAGMLSPLSEGGARRYSRGSAMHALLNHLVSSPAGEWPERAARFLAEAAPDLAGDARAALAREAVQVLGSPAFAPFLAPGARSEVGFAATLAGPDGEPVLVDGRIDRLAVVGEVVYLVDFKTHRPAPARVEDVPHAHLEQMALYRAALSQAFEGRQVEAALLWTDTAQFMPLPGALLDEALHAALTANPAPPA